MVLVDAFSYLVKYPLKCHCARKRSCWRLLEVNILSTTKEGKLYASKLKAAVNVGKDKLIRTVIGTPLEMEKTYHNILHAQV